MERNVYENEAEHAKKEQKFTIISIDNDPDSETDKVLSDAQHEAAHKLAEARIWLNENMNAEERKARIEALKAELSELMAKTRRKLDEFNERDDVKQGKVKAAAAADKLAGYISDGLEEVRQNAYVSNVISTVSDTIGTVMNDDRVRRNVKKVKKGTLKVAEHAFNGLKRVLDTDDDESQKG